MDSFSSLGRSLPVTMTGDVRTRGEQVLIQSKPQARQRPSSEIVTEDAHLAVDKRGRTLVRKRTGRHFRFGRTLNTLGVQFYVGRQPLGHVPFQESPRTDAGGSDSGS